MNEHAWKKCGFPGGDLDAVEKIEGDSDEEELEEEGSEEDEEWKEEDVIILIVLCIITCLPLSFC
jgi:hypothetical protein